MTNQYKGFFNINVLKLSHTKLIQKLLIQNLPNVPTAHSATRTATCTATSTATSTATCTATSNTDRGTPTVEHRQ